MQNRKNNGKGQLFNCIALITVIFILGFFDGTVIAQQKFGKVPKYKVTFIELGSVRCIPCQKMQAVIKSIEEKYSKQVKTIFYDVWTPAGKPYANQYAIKAIPTQVLLDEDGIEFYRHEGFLSEDKLVKILQTKGVK